jgi:hypothetical protein
MGRSPSPPFLDSYYSVDYRQDMLRLWVSGDATVIQVQSTYILAPALLGIMPSPAWAIEGFNSRAWRLMFAIVSMAASVGLSITFCLPSTAIAACLRSLVYRSSSIKRGWIGRPMIAVFSNGRQGGHQTAVIAGNHDDPLRLEAWGTLAEFVNVTAVARPRSAGQGGPDARKRVPRWRQRLRPLRDGRGRACTTSRSGARNSAIDLDGVSDRI